MTEVVFIVLALSSVVSAILVVSARNPIYSAIALLVMMLCLAGIFLQLVAPFIAIMQVVVYAGAVIVMFVFVIMLMNLDPIEMGEEKGFWYKFISLWLVVFFALFVTVAIWKCKKALPPGFPDKPVAVEKAQASPKEKGTPGETQKPKPNLQDPLLLRESAKGEMPQDFGSTERVGTYLFNPYLIPFELVSVLIVIAVVGAVVLSKRKL
ncbi:MAG: NADH-quinone oxidoreductase subunit J family protein [Planctomycetota bacterium]|jgi:NADH-quinone oxidoreductase subunit J